MSMMVRAVPFAQRVSNAYMLYTRVMFMALKKVFVRMESTLVCS